MNTNETIVIVTYKLVSAVNCPINGIVPLSELLESSLSIHKAHTAGISTRARTERQRNETIVIVTDK